MIHPRASFRTHMAKMKTGFRSTERENDEIREIEVKLDFTPNALSSLLSLIHI